MRSPAAWRVVVVCVAAAALSLAGDVASRPSSGIPPDVVSRLNAEGIEVIDAAGASGAIPAEAVRRASAFFGDSRAEIYLVRLSAEVPAKLADPDDDNSQLIPLYVDRLVWVAVDRDREIPVLGFRKPAAPATFHAMFVSFVDALTGEWLFATTAGPASTAGQ